MGQLLADMSPVQKPYTSISMPYTYLKPLTHNVHTKQDDEQINAVYVNTIIYVGKRFGLLLRPARNSSLSVRTTTLIFHKPNILCLTSLYHIDEHEAPFK